MSATENRREGFRLDDKMKLHVKIASPEYLDSVLDNFESFRMRYCLKSHLRNQTEVRLPKLAKIRKRDPEIAEYLQHLETQIEQLAARLSNDSDMEYDENNLEASVNLSSTGLRFNSDQVYEVGQQLELGMVLSTSGTQLVAIAEVLRCVADEQKGSDGGSRYLVSTFYTHIHADDTEAIIRHMAKLQQMQLQAARRHV